MNSVSSASQRQVRLPLHIVDLAADNVWTTDGGHVELRPRSYAVLRLLAERAGCLVSKDEIITKIWDDVAVTEDSLTVRKYLVRVLQSGPQLEVLGEAEDGSGSRPRRLRIIGHAGKREPAAPGGQGVGAVSPWQRRARRRPGR